MAVSFISVSFKANSTADLKTKLYCECLSKVGELGVVVSHRTLEKFSLCKDDCITGKNNSSSSRKAGASIRTRQRLSYSFQHTQVRHDIRSNKYNKELMCLTKPALIPAVWYKYTKYSTHYLKDIAVL